MHAAEKTKIEPVMTPDIFTVSKGEPIIMLSLCEQQEFKDQNGKPTLQQKVYSFTTPKCLQNSLRIFGKEGIKEHLWTLFYSLIQETPVPPGHCCANMTVARGHCLWCGKRRNEDQA